MKTHVNVIAVVLFLASLAVFAAALKAGGPGGITGFFGGG